jgi:hypothetical protein
VTIRLSVSDLHLRATFYCEFCDTNYKWPFPARTLWANDPTRRQSYPDARHVILAHFIGDHNLTKFEFPKCSKVWHPTTWEWFDEDSASLRGSGAIEIIEAWPYVSAKE